MLKKVGIVMGSDSDLPIIRKATDKKTLDAAEAKLKRAVNRLGVSKK